MALSSARILAAPARAGGGDAGGHPERVAAAVRAAGLRRHHDGGDRRRGGVALKTVYLAFYSESGARRALWNRVLRGDDDNLPVAVRDWYRAVLEEPDPERRARLYATTRRLRSAPARRSR